MRIDRLKRPRTGQFITFLMLLVTVVVCQVRSGAADEKPKSPLGGLGAGIGIATNFDVGGRRVANATVVNNIIRLEDTSSNASVSFVLEAHYFLMSRQVGTDQKWRGCGSDYQGSIFNCTEVAHGPFVAVEIGGGNSATTTTGPITGYALGWMVGLRHPQAAAGSVSWNFGLGLRVTPNAKRLGDGLVENQPLPAGDAIRYRTEPRYGVMLMSGFSF